MKWRVWVTGYPDLYVEIEEGAMSMSPITAMAWAAREFKAHWNGETIEINARSGTNTERSITTTRFVQIDSIGNLQVVP